MKKIFTASIAVILAIITSLCVISCADANETPESPIASSSPSTFQPNAEIPAEGLWASATYRSDKEFGNGAKTVKVEVKVGDRSVTFTIKTDKATLGEALLEHQLIEGENGQYGLYIKKVNGILADYDVDQSYWGFYKNGEYMMTGVDGTSIADGEHYELVRTK